MKIERFEDIEAWQQARVLANMVYEATENQKFSKDFGLRDQIQEAAGSVMHNIAEGFDSGSDLEFVRFLKYSRRSSSEVQSESYLALDRNYITPDQFQKIFDQATRAKKLINAFITYLLYSNRKRRSGEPKPEQPADQID